MTFEEFVDASAKYDLPCPTRGVIEYYALGLCGEAAETVEKLREPVVVWPLVLEMGDVLWYVAALSRWLRLWPMPPLVEATMYCSGTDVDRHIQGLVVEAGRIAEYVKKHLRDGTPIPTALVSERLVQILWRVAMLAGHFGFTLNEVAAANVDKLEQRLARRTVIGATGDDR